MIEKREEKRESIEDREENRKKQRHKKREADDGKKTGAFRLIVISIFVFSIIYTLQFLFL